ncbi:hypothetical protein V1478_013245 [Vespula squamosa]|uniref:Uncharacterized protein n=1 Tax=Vespula squamosa TaxID=30214 RepID=A0ABD2ACW6_VESSQ
MKYKVLLFHVFLIDTVDGATISDASGAPIDGRDVTRRVEAPPESSRKEEEEEVIEEEEVEEEEEEEEEEKEEKEQRPGGGERNCQIRRTDAIL